VIEVGGHKLFFGDFHGQWNEDMTNPAILIAGLTYYGYDFSVFQGPGTNAYIDGMARALELPITFFPGRECFYDWAHITTWDLEGDPPPLDNPNVKEVLTDMRKRSRMLIAAHPYDPFIPQLEGLLDEGLLDAVEIVNGGPPKIDHDRLIMQWLRRMQAKGKTVPLVGGMDIHLASGCQRPNVCFSDDYTPREDINALGRNLTAVLADSPEPEAILSAVKAGRSVVEAGGELLGNPDLIRELESAGYWEARRKAQARRDDITLAAAGDGELLATQPCELLVEPGEGDEATVRILDTLDHARRLTWSRAGGSLPVDALPHLYDRDLFALAASVQTADGAAKGFALKVRSPVEIELRPDPSPTGGGRAVFSMTNLTGQDVEGTVSISGPRGAGVADAPVGPLAPQTSGSVSCDTALAEDPSRPHPFEAQVRLSTGLVRKTRRDLVFVGVGYLENDEESSWRELPEIVLGYKDQLDPMWTSDWRGPEDISARIQVGWNERALHLRARMTDDVLCPSPRPDMPMFGDALQIGINPMNREDLPSFGIHDVWLTRHLQGDALTADRSPRIACEGLHRPFEHYTLPSSLFTNEKTADNVVTCRLALPWRLLIPMQPVAGYRFGLYLILFDNDGTGLKASLQWPRCMERDTGKAWYSVNNGTWAQMKLLAKP